MKVTNDRVKTVIYTQNRDFRTTAISMLNSISYVAEKIIANKLDDIQMYVTQDKLALNTIVDFTDETEETIATYMPKFKELVASKPNVIMVWHNSDQADFFESNAEAWNGPNLCCCKLPQAKQSFTTAFAVDRFGNKSQSVGGIPIAAKAPPPQKVPPKNAKAVGFFEASAHVKTTIAELNEVMQDRTKTKAIANIGQRFNGIIGAFAFFGDRSGYRELGELANYIDTVARVYADDSFTKVEDAHINFVVNASKCAYTMLKELRETEKLSENTGEQFMEITAEFDGIEGIKKKVNHGQEDIDSILEAAQKDKAS